MRHRLRTPRPGDAERTRERRHRCRPRGPRPGRVRDLDHPRGARPAALRGTGTVGAFLPSLLRRLRRRHPRVTRRVRHGRPGAGSPVLTRGTRRAARVAPPPAAAPLVRVGHDAGSRVRARPAWVTIGAVAVARRRSSRRRGDRRRPIAEAACSPSFRQRDLLVHWDGAPGIVAPGDEPHRVARRGRAAHDPGVRNVGAHVGRAIMSDERANVNTGEIWVSIDPARRLRPRPSTPSSRPSTAIPASTATVTTYPADRIAEVFGAAGARRRRSASTARTSTIARDQGRGGRGGDRRHRRRSSDASVTATDQGADRRDRGRPGQGGRSTASRPATSGAPPTSLLSGIEVGNLFEEQKVFEVVVWGTPEHRAQPRPASRACSSIRPTRGLVRLGDVADVNVAPVPSRDRRAKASCATSTSRQTSGPRHRRRRRRRPGGRRGGRRSPSSTTPKSTAQGSSGRTRRCRLLAVAAGCVDADPAAPPGTLRRLATRRCSCCSPCRGGRRWRRLALATGELADPRRPSPGSSWSSPSRSATPSRLIDRFRTARARRRHTGCRSGDGAASRSGWSRS